MQSSALFPVHQNLAHQGCLLSVLCALCYCVMATFSFYLVIYSGSLFLLCAVFGPCGISGPVWGHVGLELSQARHLLVQSHQTAGHFPSAIL